MQHIEHSMRTLCDDLRMLTGLALAYGTADKSESVRYGRAQEVTLADGQWIACERPLTADSLYDLASLTKFFMSVMCMILVERGMLRLDECVDEIDPRFEHLRRVTVFDTLCYRVCLQTPGRIDDAPDREEGLRRLFAVRVAPSPSVRIYSDINAMVIKYVIEAKTGLPLYDALRRFILSPAGMRETYAAVPTDCLPRCVCYNYEHRIAGERYILRTQIALGEANDPKAQLLSDSGRDLCGHAGLFSTCGDMTRFAQALLAGELISPASLAEIAADRTLRRNPDGTYRQPLGFLCFARHPEQRLSEVPAYMSDRALAISGFTGNHFALDPQTGCFELLLGNRCHARVSHIVPPEGVTLAHYGLDERGAGLVPWPDGRKVPTSARYVYLKDALLHEPAAARMRALGWLQ